MQFDPHVSTRDVQLIGKRNDLIRSDRIGNDDQSIEWCKGDDVDRCGFREHRGDQRNDFSRFGVA